MAVVVEEIFEVLGWGLGSFLAYELEVFPQPLPPAWIILPWNAIPEIEELQITLGTEGSDLAHLGPKRGLHHLQGSHASVVESFALCKDNNVLELVIVITDVVEVSLSFAAVVVELLEFEVRFVRGPAF